MGHKMKYPKGKGFPFKEKESPLKHYVAHGWHDHDDPDDPHYDGGPDWDGSHVGDDEHLNPNNTDTPSTDDPGTVSLYDNGWDHDGSGADLPNWADKYVSGEPLIEPSLDPDRESILGQQAREREESGAHRYARGNQSENPDTAVYPYPPVEYEQNEYDVDYPFDEPFNPDDYPDGWGAGFDNLIEVPDEPVGEAEVDENPIRDPIISTDNDPDGDGEANVDPDRGPSTRPRPNVSYLSDRPDNVSPANTRPNSRPNVSPADTRPNTSPVNTRPNVIPGDKAVTKDIFGNEVGTVDNRGRQVPYTTVTTPKTHEFGRNQDKDVTKGKRGYKTKIRPGWMDRYNNGTLI